MGAPFRALTLGYGAFRAIRNAGVLTILMGAPVWSEPVTIAALGDSLTQGYGLVPDQGFVPQLQRWLEGAGAEVVVINAGVSGDTTAGGLSRIEWTLTPEVDGLIVALGGNDLLRGIDPAVSRENLAGILDIASARGLPVLLVGLDAPSNFGAEWETAFEAMYPDLSSQYKTLLYNDFMEPLRADANQAGALETFMQPDRIHPNAQGVARVVEGIGPSVLELIARAAE